MKKAYIAPEMVIDSMITEELICLSIQKEFANDGPSLGNERYKDCSTDELW